jgi:hypothetical protein
LKWNNQKTSQKKETASRVADQGILPKNFETWKSPSTFHQNVSLNNPRNSQEKISSAPDLFPQEYTGQDNPSKPITSSKSFYLGFLARQS